MVYAKRSARAGFTLMELMIVIAILGLLMAFLVPTIWNAYEKAQVSKAKAELLRIKTAINGFNIDTNMYPARLNDLVKPPRNEEIARKWGGGLGKKGAYMKKLIKRDPWNNPYVYKRAPYKDNPYTLFSYGIDGKKGKTKMHVWDFD